MIFFYFVFFLPQNCLKNINFAIFLQISQIFPHYFAKMRLFSVFFTKTSKFSPKIHQKAVKFLN